MAVPAIQTSFSVGEASPNLFGHVDLARMHAAASTFRNGFVSYLGGFYSRAGTKFVGFSKQTGRNYPPRLITFQFNINQGLALEFGNYYMRVISNGAFVTESPISITGISQADPGVVTIAAFSADSATSNNGSVSSSYEAEDTITLAGGTFTSPAILLVDSTSIKSLSLNSSGSNAVGSGYVPGNTINLTGGVFSEQAQVAVSTTKVISATILNPGGGGTPGPATVTGTTGTGTKFQASVTIGVSGFITSINSISLGGSYTVNPTNLGNEPVTGGGLTNARFRIAMGVATFNLTNPGMFSVNAFGGIFTQAFTSGSGIGATFNSALFSPGELSISDGGIYSVFPTNPVSQASTSGSGAGATFDVESTAASFVDGDWLYLSDIGGMTELNGETFVINRLTLTTYQLFDVYGNTIDTTGFSPYTSGGTASRIFTLTTPYSEVDLAYLKFTQSADVMSLCLVNQVTRTEYAPQDLSRISDTDWEFSPAVPEATVDAPASMSGAASSSGSVDYQYVATAISPVDGTESVASPIAKINSAVNIAATAGSITLTWAAVLGVNEYNIYKATPGQSAEPPVGSLFGFAGSAYGTQFIDSNIVADFSQVPPTHKNPFARGQVTGAEVSAGGTGYTTVTLTINSTTGTGAILQGVLVGGILVAVIVVNAGENYTDSDTITVTGSGGSGATATLLVGAQFGTYPSVVSYFQQRRVYANTLNNPDTYFMSQPGSFTNFDSRIPTIDSDAIIGTPWSVQVDGIQFLTPMPGGLVAHTGLSAWQLTGSGGGSLNPQPITPSSQGAQPQGYNGCSATVPPIKIDQDIIFVQAKGSIYRNISYQIQGNVYTGIDMTLNSSHLFTGFTTIEHAWCEEPFKVLWSVRNDGILRSLTYLKPQEVAGWGRHDTNGLFKSVCSVTEPPVDSLYLAAQRFPGENTAYMIERMDDRLWSNVEECWCVDCGLSLPQPEPNATLRASSATGLGAITGVTDLIGGTGYSDGTTAEIIDDNGEGPGTGAIVFLTINAGVITAIDFTSEGSGYVYPALVISDPANTGSGASATPILDNSATFTASDSVFSMADVGSVIRMGGGIATITEYVDPENVIADISSPIIQTIPNSGGVPQDQPSGSWSMTAPVSSVRGLKYLAGATVTGLADGNVIPPIVVPADGDVPVPSGSTAVTIGLGFQAQLQSIYLNTGEPTLQGQRKKIPAVTARIESSRGLKIGSNMPDGSTQSPMQNAPAWFEGDGGLTDVPDNGPNFPRAPYNSTAIPLRTGDVRIPISGGYQTPGQVAIQQDNPLPMQVLAFINEVEPGDTPQTTDRKRAA